MNNPFIRFGLFVLFAIFCHTGKAAVAQNPIDTLVVKTNIYCSHCMECETCKDLLVDDLLDEKGITDIKLDAKNMTITVVYKPKKITPGEIRAAIAKRGYDADNVKADPEGYEKLDGCCKKE